LRQLKTSYWVDKIGSKGPREADYRRKESGNSLRRTCLDKRVQRSFAKQSQFQGEPYVETVRRLQDDKDFREQVEEAGEKLNASLVRKALACFGQRPRDQARKQQETDSV
jgi:hypothetical protein